MNANDDYICLVLGETGVGKSSFINGITNSNNCEVGDEGKACTVKFKISKANIGNSQYSFIDTPGLNDAKGDEKNINEIKNGLSEYPNFRCILVLLKFQDTRLNRTTLNNLQTFMKCFPTKKFWEHVFIVRTHAEKNSRSFNQTKKKLKGEIVNSINNYDDFKDFKNFMIKKNIELPQKIDEYFVDNVKDEPDNFEYNEEEFNKIFEKIKNTKPMFKKIKKVDSENIEENGPFTVKQKWRKIIFIDYEGNEINSSPYLSTEDEASNLKTLRIKRRKEVLETESDCGDVRIKYAYYETKIYEFGGKEICGKECYKGTGWE
jgi:GTPase Era involved in 16S rRNA processing